MILTSKRLKIAQEEKMMLVNTLTTEEKSFLAVVLPIFESLGEVTIKKSFGGKKITINGTKIGGLIKDQSRYILQLKPTKKGAKTLLTFSENYQESLPFAGGTPNFTLVRLDNAEFLQNLIYDTYYELSTRGHHY
jgi:hypothetical protein